MPLRINGFFAGQECQEQADKSEQASENNRPWVCLWRWRKWLFFIRFIDQKLCGVSLRCVGCAGFVLRKIGESVGIFCTERCRNCSSGVRELLFELCHCLLNV